MFGELFHEKRAVIQEDQVVVVRGKVVNDEFSGGLRITVVRVLDGFGPHHFRGATVTVAT